jgi:hypothetical protein
MSHAIERMRQERFKAFIEHSPAHRRSERDMAEASRHGRLLQSEPEKPLPEVPLHERGFGVMEKEGPSR